MDICELTIWPLNDLTDEVLVAPWYLIALIKAFKTQRFSPVSPFRKKRQFPNIYTYL